jgi:4-phytase/acid phosphatase
MAALAAAVATGPADAKTIDGASLKLERVVMLMRHGIRPPTKAMPIPARYSPDAWPSWSVAPGLLTERGAAGAALLGGADRSYLVAAGLLPAKGCPAPGTVSIVASAKQRAIRTAEEWAKRLVPGCAAKVDHPTEDGPDPIFHGLDDQPAWFDGHKAYLAAVALAPGGNVEAETALHRPKLRLLARVLGCAKPACDLESEPTKLVESPHDRPDLEGPLDVGSTASQSLLLEYLEGMPMRQVGWGRVSRAEIEQLLEFHPVKFKYANRPAYVAQAAAGPLIDHMVHALTGKGAAGRISLMAGHDTNVADLAALLDLHWHVPSYPADDVPPGSALGFELRRDKAGNRFVRAFYRAQTMDQLRNQQRIDGTTGPYRDYIDIPGCGEASRPRACTLPKFLSLVARKRGAGQP